MASFTALKPAGWPALAVISVTLLPLLAVLALALGWGAGGAEPAPASGTWAHLIDTGLARYAANSVLLVLLVALGVTLVGVGSAWLTVMCEFPGRRTVAWLLALPLALPAYVIAYAYTDFLQFTGPLQSGLRALIGVDGLEWRARGYWFPEVRSLPGAALMFVLVLYPYVYLPVRAAFASGGASQFEAARTLGMSARRAFVRVMLPLARPAMVIAAIQNAVPIWNDFFFPLIFISSERLKTLPQGLTVFMGEYNTDWGVLFAGLSLAALPIVAVYVVLSRHFIEGMTQGAIK